MKTKEYLSARKKLAGLLLPGSIAVLQSNDVMPSNSDGTLPYRPNSDLLRLTGISSQNCVLLLFPDHPDNSLREILFIPQPDETHGRWHGKQLTQAQASGISGVNTIRWQHQFESIFHALLARAEYIYLNTIEHPRSENQVQTREQRFAQWCQTKYPLHSYKRLAPLCAKIRLSKSEAELELMREACRISGLGFGRLLRFVKPGVNAKQVEAELIHEYLQHGAGWAGYQPIIAAGQNSCILHYIDNINTCLKGDVLLVDAAASHLHYNADLTRVLPVSGKFTSRQKQVYKAVHHIQKELIRFIKPGMYWKEIENLKNELVCETLIKLRLCTSRELKQSGCAYFINKYSYHGFGHWLGLDVHDVGDTYEKIPENCAITVEPGIYIWEENIGVRLENNIVVKPKGNEDLTGQIPIEADEIEQLMNA